MAAIPQEIRVTGQGLPWENKWSRWAHGELTVTTVVTAPGPNDHGSVMARRGHSSVTARSQLSHSSVTARSQLNHGIFSMITAQSRLGDSSITAQVTAGCDHFGHRELTVSSPQAHGEQSRWPIFLSWAIRRPGALCPDVSGSIAPGQKANPRSTPILTPLQLLFGDL